MNTIDARIHTSAPPRRSKRLMVTVAGLAISALVLAGCWNADQDSELSLVNATRKANGLPALTGNLGVMNKAQAWSVHMARTGTMEHTGGGTKLDTKGLPCWRSVGENVGKGSSLQSVHDAFLKSPVHKANILGNFDHVGYGAYKVGNTWWVTQIFYRAC